MKNIDCYSVENLTGDRTDCWFDFANVPGRLLDICYSQGERKFGHPSDVFTPLKLGKKWLFQLTCQYQPRTGLALMQGGQLVVTGDRVDETPAGYQYVDLSMECGGKRISVVRGCWGDNHSDCTWQKISNDERYLSLPEPIRMAYYHRFDGLDIPKGQVAGINSRLLPFPIGRPWQSFDGYLKSIGIPFSQQEVWYQWAIERGLLVRPRFKGDPFTSLMVFLDTRPTLQGRLGTVLLVKNHVQDGVIYVVVDGDLESMMILAEPAEAVDRYCEGVLLDNNYAFNFGPYCIPLAELKRG